MAPLSWTTLYSAEIESKAHYAPEPAWTHSLESLVLALSTPHMLLPNRVPQ